MRGALALLRRQAGRIVRTVRSRAARLGEWLRGPEIPSAARMWPLRLKVLRVGAGDSAEGADYVYSPVHADQCLDRTTLENVALCLSHRGYDFVLVSRALTEWPTIAAPLEVRQSVIFAQHISDVFLAPGFRPKHRLRGRIVRMPALKDESPELHIEQLLPGVESGAELGEVEWGPNPAVAPFPLTRVACLLPDIPKADRPRVFVLPALWAVGGVERNTTEIMRHLGDRYEFIVISLERLNEQLGSLHDQSKDVARTTYDLAELSPQSDYMAMFATLRRSWKPDVVWICNGSPWQCDHAGDLRELFSDIPIVDQEVYDTEAGWINRYHEPGIQSFDRFIAINQRIRAAFVERLNINPLRIDLIYSAIPGSRSGVSNLSTAEIERVKESYGLPPKLPVFLFVGRMVSQKRPLDFVELATRLVAGGLQASFLMVGDGELRPDVDAAIARSAVPSVRRLPFSNRLAEILSIADGLIVTSEYEGLPIAMLEGLAQGVPVLSTDVGDVRLVLEEYGSGAIMGPTGDLEAMEKAFLSWCADLSRYRKAAREAAPQVARRFSGESLAEAYDRSWRRAYRDRRSADLFPKPVV